MFVFITFVKHNRREILIPNIDLFKESLKYVKTKYLFDIFAKKRNKKGIWQRRCYDYIIRDEEDLHKHADYIHYNPTKHYKIAPKDWKFSSFNKFVQNKYYEKDWCNYNNEYKIDELAVT